MYKKIVQVKLNSTQMYTQWNKALKNNVQCKYSQNV